MSAFYYSGQCSFPSRRSFSRCSLVSTQLCRRRQKSLHLSRTTSTAHRASMNCQNVNQRHHHTQWTNAQLTERLCGRSNIELSLGLNKLVETVHACDLPGHFLQQNQFSRSVIAHPLPCFPFFGTVELSHFFGNLEEKCQLLRVAP